MQRNCKKKSYAGKLRLIFKTTSLKKKYHKKKLNRNAPPKTQKATSMKWPFAQKPFNFL